MTQNTDSEIFQIFGKGVLKCKYGENGYQAAAVYSTGSDDPLAIDKFTSISGDPLSYNNICDLDRLINTLTHFAAGFALNFPKETIPEIAIAVKHGNPCGASWGHWGRDANQVLRNMIIGDTRAIFGGVVLTNFEIDREQAEILMTYKSEKGNRLLDGIIAPSFSKEGFDILSQRTKCRLVINQDLGTRAITELDKNYRFRYLRGGFAVQSNYDYIIRIDESARVFGSLSYDDTVSMILAWAIGCTSNSNTVTLVKNRYLIGNGVGQQDRVGCCELAIKRAETAKHATSGATAYSDSFFPFPDGPKVLIDNGITSIFASSGSVKDKEVIELCQNNNINLYMAPDKKCRGFFGH